MKLGVSSYSFRPLLMSGALSIEGMFDWLAAHRAEHLEIASFSFAASGKEDGYDLTTETETLTRIGAASRAAGIPVSGICIGASFIDGDTDGRQAEIEAVKRHIELCNRLEVRFLRHDVVPWSLRLTEEAQFERAFPVIVEACQEVADFAATQGVTTSVEDHGFFMNSSGRIKRLLHAVGRSNFKFTVDVGNFLCVDEDAVVATRASLADASFIHLKDFYVRRTLPGPGWLETLGGRYIRGSVFGFGDLETEAIIQSIVASGYDGYVSLEYEGHEPTLSGCETGLGNIRRMLGQ